MMKMNTKELLINRVLHIKTLILACSFLFLLGGNVYAQFPNPYCNTTFPNNVEPITLVQFAGISNATDETLNGTPALEDFTLISANVTPGSSYSISVNGNTFGSYHCYFYIYIDWNQNGDFSDEGETYSLGAIYNTDGAENSDPLTGDILVPINAPEGNTRMRVLKKFNASSDPGSCNTGGYGQAEDYTIAVSQAPCTPPAATFTVVPDCDDSQFSIDIAITDLGDATSINITNGTLNIPATATGSYNIGPFASGSTQTITLIHGGNTVCNLSSDPIIYNCPLANDECSTATPITSLPYTSTEDATDASQTDFVTACPSGMNDGVWYQVAGTGCQMTVVVDPNGWDPAVGIFSGNCGDLECVTRVDGAASGGTETATFSTIAGATYFINIGYYSSSSNGSEGPFDISVSEDCCPTPADVSTNNITSAGAAVTWSGSANSIVEYGPAGFTPGTGATAGADGTVAAVAGSSYEIGNLNPETDYDVYVRSDCGGGTYSDNSDVESFTTPPPPPINDDCSGAIAFPTIPVDGSCASVTANTTGATQSMAGCAGTADDDIWYSFVCPAGVDSLLFQNTSVSGNGDRVIQFFSGDCSNLISLKCSDPESGGVGGLTPGETYYFRIYTYSSGNSTEVTVCLKTPPPPPVNDEATGAIELTMDAGCTGTPYTNKNATHSTGEPVNSCYQALTQAYPSVWFKFTAPASGAVKVSTDYSGGSLSDTHLGLFEAGNASDYNTFNIIACDDDNGTDDGGGDAKSILYATGLTAGNTYYVIVNGYNNQSGTFCVTVDELASSMLSTSASCTGGQALYAREYYTGQSSIVDDDGNLIAIVKRNTAGTGTSTNSYSNSLNINTGAQRADAYGVPYLDRNFRITYSQSSPPSDFDVQFFFLNSELTSLGTDLSELNISRVEGSSCIDDFAGVATLLTQNNNGSANGISWIDVTTPGFSNFFIHAGNAPLPIKLGDITAKNNGTVNDIAWNTLDEREGDYFELERSIDGKSFASIATINAKGIPAHYTYTDANPVKGINYYRLHLLNNDGSRGYSKIVAAEVMADVHSGINVFPNPTSGNIFVRINGNINGHARIIITDISGKVVNTISNININDVAISMSELSAGLYFVKYTDDNFTQTVKVTKK